jgi:bifunctional oligoribonuclease and PAP phosphatase NrnA
MTMSRANPNPPEIGQIVEAIRVRQRFVLSSHARPDGDSLGSQLAMAYALRALGNEVVVVNADAAPATLMLFPGVADIRIAPDAGGPYDAAIIMECGDLARTGVAGLDRSFVINIDHHPGNTNFGHINWFDGGAAACAEMVFDLVRALGVPLSIEIATHIYLAIVTDTGSFHYSSISPRTFDICRQVLEAGVDPVALSRQVFDSNTVGRLRMFGAVMQAMELDPTGRIAVLYLDRAIAAATRGDVDDTDGLINQPLTVKNVQAVVFFRHVEGTQYRVSMRSKGAIDIGAIAKTYGGGGHRNAAGCSAAGAIDALRKTFVEQVERAIDGRPADY